jgi:hypothetical protein
VTISEARRRARFIKERVFFLGLFGFKQAGIRDLSDHLILLEWVHVGDELIHIEAIRLPQGPSVDVTEMV